MFGEAWPPDWQKLAYHDFQYEQTFHVAKVKMGSGWPEFVKNSQQYQADLLKFAIEHYRRAKYKKIGSFFQFRFVDCWPSVTWSVLSYARKPKLGYFALQRAYQPVLIGADLAKTTWGKGKNLPEDAAGAGASARLWVVNDEHREIQGAICEARLRGQGRDVAVGTAKPKDAIPADSVMDFSRLAIHLPSDLPPGDYELVLTLKEGERILSENSYPVTLAE
jgi:beta-mannosidase